MAVELKDVLQPMSLEERHWIVTEMLDTYMKDPQATEPLIFHDVQTAKEDAVLFQLIETKYPKQLTWRHTTEADKEEVYQPVGKLVLTKVSMTTTTTATGEEDTTTTTAAATASAESDDNVSLEVLSAVSSDDG